MRKKRGKGRGKKLSVTGREKKRPSARFFGEGKRKRGGEGGDYLGKSV